MTYHLVVAIDPGKNTGFALLDTLSGKFAVVESMMIHEAMEFVRTLHVAADLSHVVFEDARLRKWFGTKRGTKEDAARKQGAGSVKRDCTIWSDFLGDLNIPFKTISPQGKGTKMDAKRFAHVTGWTERTNEHGRDAGAMIWGARALQREAA